MTNKTAENIEEDRLYSELTEYQALVEHIKNVCEWDQKCFDKSVAFARILIDQKLLKEEGFNFLNHIFVNHLSEFIELYNSFIKANSNELNVESYQKDFKSFVAGKQLTEVERIELTNKNIEKQKANWFKGIMDSFNQEPNNDQYWNDDPYFSGYQRGTQVFRELLKESKILFAPQNPTKNLFIEQQKQLVEIINKFQKN
jgi:hypothetical protein